MREIKGATRVGWDLEMPTPPGNGPPSHTKLINPLEREGERENGQSITELQFSHFYGPLS